MASYLFGNLIRLSATFTRRCDRRGDRSYDGEADDHRSDRGDLELYLSHGDREDSTGNYHYDVDAEPSGTWQYRWNSTGSGQAANERQFTVRPSSFH